LKFAKRTSGAICLVATITAAAAQPSLSPSSSPSGLAHIMMVLPLRNLKEALLTPSLEVYRLYLVYDEQLAGAVVAQSPHYEVAVSIRPSEVERMEVCDTDENYFYFEKDIVELNEDLYKSHKPRCLKKFPPGADAFELGQLQPTLVVLDSHSDKRLLDMTEAIYVPEDVRRDLIRMFTVAHFPLPPGRNSWFEVFKSSIKPSVGNTTCEGRLRAP
jgi:hypothetical protein